MKERILGIDDERRHASEKSSETAQLRQDNKRSNAGTKLPVRATIERGSGVL